MARFFFYIFFSLSFERNFFLQPEFPFNSGNLSVDSNFSLIYRLKAKKKILLKITAR